MIHRFFQRVSLVVLGAMCLASVQARADVIPTLFNTGVDSAGAVLPGDTIGDPHYSLISVPGGTSDIRIISSAGGWPIPPYMADNTSSRWIGPNNDADLTGPVGTFIYRTTFSLAGFAPGTASILGGWSTDNNGLDILLNGVSLGFTTPFTSFSSGFSPFAISSGFVAGVNTLDFVVNNGGLPTALRVEMSGTAAVPEPSSLALLAGAGTSALLLVLRRRRA